MNPYDPDARQGQASGTPFTPPTYQPTQPTPPRAATKAPLVDLNQVTPGQWAVLGGGVVMFIGSFLPWYTYTYTSGRQTQSLSYIGWDSSLGKATAIIALLTVIFFLVSFFHVKLSFTLPATERAIYVGLGAEALLLVVLYLFNPTGIPVFGLATTAGPSIGLFLTLLAAIATIVGGTLHPNRPLRP